MSKVHRHNLFFILAMFFVIVSLMLSAVLPVLASSIEDDLSDLIVAVEALVADDSLSPANGNALIAKLEAAQQSLARDRANAASNQLEAFMNQVGAAIQSGRLDPVTGQALLSEAAYIQAVAGCTDPLGCAVFRADEPIRLATALVTSGEIGLLGLESQQGVQIALDLNGDLFGHQLELRAEDTGCSPEGATAAANTLVADPKVVAIVGTSCSGSAVAAAPIVSDAGYVMVSPSNTAPVLTHPQYHSAGYLRTIHNDKEQAVVMVELLRMQGEQTSAVLTVDESYTLGLADIFVETFLAGGGTNLAYEIVPFDDPGSIEAALDAIAAVGPPDVLYMPMFIWEAYLTVIQARERPEFDGTILASPDGIAAEIFFNAAGPAAEGLLFTSPEFDFSTNDLYATVFMPAYIAKYGEPLAPFHPFAFDAANMILDGIEVTAVVKEGTVRVGRQALRDALFATEGMEGATGTITCDPFGDCGGNQIVVYEVIDGTPVPIWPE